ncbi:uncharacterized protein LOC142177214 [Nicotiana tabacum]|uniref:Uncharacterized protein LOC142177214 n=1 Tax=Nicotiana tabacum TaxID=4097 RepID=A0AC58TX26_TOBAC
MGDHVLDYSRILDYRDEMLRSNPGITCVFKLSEEIFEGGKKIFVGFYICFDALKKAFKVGCRPYIGLDDFFLKGVCKEQLLVTVCKDGNNQMLPLAWVVVEDDFDLRDGTNFTFITDMHKGLYQAMDEVLPNCEHRMCARHILANWSKALKEEIISRGVPESTYKVELRKNLDFMECLGGNGIIDDLFWYNKERWYKVYFKFFSNCDIVDNNTAKNFNCWILEPRHKKIITMLDKIRVKRMNKFG